MSVSSRWRLQHCDEMVGSSYLRCPHCMSKLRDPCGSCGRPLDPEWLLCPYCEAEIPGVTPSPEDQERERRRRERELERMRDDEAGEIIEEYDVVAEDATGEYQVEGEVDLFAEENPARPDDVEPTR